MKKRNYKREKKSPTEGKKAEPKTETKMRVEEQTQKRSLEEGERPLKLQNVMLFLNVN